MADPPLSDASTWVSGRSLTRMISPISAAVVTVCSTQGPGLNVHKAKRPSGWPTVMPSAEYPPETGPKYRKLGPAGLRFVLHDAGRRTS